MWLVSRTSRLTLLLVRELSRCGEDGCEAYKFHQIGTAISHTFLWACVLVAQIHLCMCAQYMDKVLSRRIVYEWINMFENGRTIVTDAERSGLPSFKDLFSKRIKGVEHLSQVQLIVTCFIEI
jgi:hypothetical protein